MNYFAYRQELRFHNCSSLIDDVLTKLAPVKLSYVNFSVSKNGLFSFRLQTFAGSR